MTLIPIYIEEAGANGAALYGSPIMPGKEFRFFSQYEREVKAIFLHGSPFSSPVISLETGKTERIQVRLDALSGHYPFSLKAGDKTLGSNLRIAVGESVADRAGFWINKTGEVVYQVIFDGREAPAQVQAQVRVENDSRGTGDVKLTVGQGTAVFAKLPAGETLLHPEAVVLEKRETAEKVRASIWLRDAHPLDVGQGGGTVQVDVVVDPDA